MKKYITKNFDIVLFWLIVLTALFLRLYRLENFMTFLDDSGRDVVVAKKLSENFSWNISPYVGPMKGLINNSPFYYWLLSIFWLFGFNSPKMLTAIFVVIGVLAVIFFGKVGARAFGVWGKYIFMLFSAFSFRMVMYSRSIFQTHILPLFITLTVLSYQKMRVKKNILFLITTSLLSHLLLHIHFSSVFIFIPMMILINYYAYEYWKKGFVNGKQIILLFFENIALTILDYITFFRGKSIGKVFASFVNFQSVNSLSFSLSEGINVMTGLVGDVFNMDVNGLLAIGSLLFGWLVYRYVVNCGKLKIRDDEKFLINFLVMIMFLFIIFSLFTENMHFYRHYFTIFSVVLIMLLAVFVVYVLRENKLIGVVFGLLILTQLVRGNGWFFSEDKIPNEYKQTKEAIRYVLDDYKHNFPPYVMSVSNENGVGWGVGSYGYWIEEMTGKEYLEVNEHSNNLKVKKEFLYSDVAYLICESTDYDKEFEEECFAKWVDEQNRWMRNNIDVINMVYKFDSGRVRYIYRLDFKK